MFDVHNRRELKAPRAVGSPQLAAPPPPRPGPMNHWKRVAGTNHYVYRIGTEVPESSHGDGMNNWTAATYFTRPLKPSASIWIL